MPVGSRIADAPSPPARWKAEAVSKYPPGAPPTDATRSRSAPLEPPPSGDQALGLGIGPAALRVSSSSDIKGLPQKRRCWPLRRYAPWTGNGPHRNIVPGASGSTVFLSSILFPIGSERFNRFPYLVRSALTQIWIFGRITAILEDRRLRRSSFSFAGSNVGKGSTAVHPLSCGSSSGWIIDAR